MSTLLKHDRYQQTLLESIQADYERVIVNMSILSSKNRLVAEVDILGINPDSIDVFEVKCGYRITKAKKQLKKIRKLLFKRFEKPVNTYFYHGGGDELIRIE